MAKATVQPAVTYRAIVGRLLANRRELLRMDQQVVAAAVGVTQPTWSRIETGGTPLSIDQLKRACERLNLLPGNVLREADLASTRLAKQGVSIATTADEPSENTLAFLGGAALAALLLSALAKK